MYNVVIKFALLFETLLAFILIYIPGLNSGLQLGMLHALMFCVTYLMYACLCKVEIV